MHGGGSIRGDPEGHVNLDRLRRLAARTRRAAPAGGAAPAGRALIGLLLGSAALLLTSGPAAAAFPQDVTLSQLDTYKGVSFTNYTDISAAWHQVARDIGTGIANQPVGASTLGLDGFDVGLGTRLTFVDGHRYQGGPTAWERVREGNQGSGALFMPGVHLRKGLPLSFEIGGQLSWLGFTRQGVVGFYGRFAPLESFDKAPEVALQVGRSGYIGNDELSVSTNDAHLVVGKTVAFASTRGARTSTVHPFVGFGMNWIKATPRLPAERLEDLEIGALGPSKKDTATYDPDMRQMVATAGVRIVSGDVGLRVNASLPFASVPSLETSFGYVF